MDPNQTDSNQNERPAIPGQGSNPDTPQIIQPTMDTPDEEPAAVPPSSAPVEPSPPPSAPSDEPVPDSVNDPNIITPVSLTAPAVDVNNQQGGESIPSVTSVQPNGSRKSKKKLFLLIGLTLFFIILLGGFVFGYYLPNKPQNVWNTGLNRTGMVIDKLVTATTEEEQLDKYKKSEITATLVAKLQGGSYNATATAKFDATKTDGSVTITTKEGDKPDQDINLEFLSELPDGSVFPNIFFKLKGIQASEFITLLPMLAAYDDKWIAVEQEYLKSIGATPTTAEENEQDQISSKDIAEFSQAMADILQEYVFTTNPEKAIVVQKSYVGKETLDSIKAYHYTAGLHVEHTKALCEASINKIYESNLYKKLLGNPDGEAPSDEDRKAAISDCQQSIDDDTANTTFDIWVDSKYKLMHKVRFSEKEDTEKYVEFGQLYKGGENFSFFINQQDKKEPYEVKFVMDVDFKNSQTKATLSAEGGEGENAYSVKVTLDAKPYEGEISVTKPENAIPVAEVLQALGMDPAPFFGSGMGDNGTGAGSGSKDAERRTDIKSLHGQLEAHYAQHGYYPSRANMNSPSWRGTNMIGLSDDSLQDPDSSSTTLASAPAQKVYSYQVTSNNSGNCETDSTNCAQYILTATLSDGSTYTKTNLN